MELPFNFAELRRRPDYPAMSGDLATSNVERAPIGPGYEQMPTSTNVEDRQSENDFVRQLVHTLTGFNPDFWKMAYRSFWEPLPPSARYEPPPHSTSDLLSVQAGYNEIPKVYSKRVVPAPDFWTSKRF